ncbi:MAG: hypothetical protein COC03_07245 [Robiginitomaculum sp.]|nr:MAG: hypothetical protein COC03_07245 [Robiginitomaculum sp.]
MSTVLFVYGTLAPGEENARIMDGEWRKASVRGKRNDKGWGVNKGHPGFIPDKNGDVVNGLIFTSNDLPANWARLDEFEGVDYKRVSIKATLENGDVIETQIYSAV